MEPSLQASHKTIFGLQNVFSVTIVRLPRRLEDILQRLLEDVLQGRIEDVLEDKKTVMLKTLKTSWRHVFKTSWRHALNTSWRMSWRHIFKTSWRQKKYEYLYLANLNVRVSNKSIFHKFISAESKANWNSLVRTQ